MEKEKKAISFLLKSQTHKKAKSFVRNNFDDNGVLITDP